MFWWYRAVERAEAYAPNVNRSIRSSRTLRSTDTRGCGDVGFLRLLVCYLSLGSVGNKQVLLLALGVYVPILAQHTSKSCAQPPQTLDHPCHHAAAQRASSLWTQPSARWALAGAAATRSGISAWLVPPVVPY